MRLISSTSLLLFTSLAGLNANAAAVLNLDVLDSKEVTISEIKKIRKNQRKLLVNCNLSPEVRDLIIVQRKAGTTFEEINRNISGDINSGVETILSNGTNLEYLVVNLKR